MGVLEMQAQKDRMKAIVKDNGFNEAIRLLMSEGFCSSKSEAKRIYFQLRG